MRNSVLTGRQPDRQRGRGRGVGQSVVEFAIILPVLLIIVCGLLDIGRLYYAYVAVTDAAAEGAAYAAVHPDDLAGIYERAQDASGGLVQLSRELVGVERPTVRSGAPVTVTVAYTFTFLTPLMQPLVPGGTLRLQAQASAVILAGEF